MVFMRRIDRYIIRQFILATIVSLAGFIVIFIAIDMMEKLDKFIDRKVPWPIVFEYYVNFVPQMITLVLPISLLLGSLFTAGKMSQNTEIVALRSAGMSLYRFMVPFVIIATLVSGMAVYFNGWIAPRANVRLLSLRREYLKDEILRSSEYNMHMQNAPGEFLVVGEFSITQSKAQRVGLYYFDANDRTKLVKRIDAGMMVWDSTKRTWKLENAIERTFPDSSIRNLPKEVMRRLRPEESYVKLTFTPQDLRDRQLKTNELSELTATDLARRIDLSKRAGKESARDEVDFHAKFAMSFTSLIVVLFGVPFASQKKRGGLALEFAVAIGIAFFYLAFTKVSFTFGYSGAIDPVITAWMANGIFMTIAILVMARVQK